MASSSALPDLNDGESSDDEPLQVSKNGTSESSESSSSEDAFEDSPHWTMTSENSFLSREIGKIQSKKMGTTDATSPIGTPAIVQPKVLPTPKSAETKSKVKRKATDSEEKAGKSKKAKRDPNGPKGPKNSFLIFSDYMRMKLKQEQPNMSPQDLKKALSTLWKEVPEVEKKEYVHKAELDKERFQKEKAIYEAQQAKVTPVEQDSFATPFKVERADGEGLKRSKYFANKTDEQAKKKKSVILKIKKDGDSHFERIKLRERTIEGLVRKIEEKYPESGKVETLFNLPDVAVTDTEGVKCLSNGAEIVITFTNS